MTLDGLLVRIYRVPALALLIRAVARPGVEPTRWVFVHGCYGSGTTLLFDFLKSLGGICGPQREGVMYTQVLPRPETSGWNRLWLEQELAMVPSGGDVKKDAEQLRRDWRLFYDGSPTFVEKSISNIARAEWLSHAFPGCLHVNVVRDPWAVCEGMLRKARPQGAIAARYPNGYPLELVARQWTRTVELQRDIDLREGGVPLVRYERLMRDPIGELEAVAHACSADLSGVTWSATTSRLSSGTFDRELRDRDAFAHAKLDKSQRDLIARIVAPVTHGDFAYALPD